MRIIRSIVTSLTLSFAIALAAPALAADKELKSVGLTVGDLGNSFFDQIAHCATAHAKTLNPEVKVTALSSNYDMKNQASQMKDFISSGVELIILGAANSKTIAPSVKQAKARGIVGGGDDAG